MTHYIPMELLRPGNANSSQRAACGAYVRKREHSSDPSCIDCIAWLNSEDEETGNPFGSQEADMTRASAEEITVKFQDNERGNPPGKLADAELHFRGGILDGLKLIGFGLWERRGGGGLNVTFPARQYSVNGERRSFALLRPTSDQGSQERIKTFIIEAWDNHVAARDGAVGD